MNEGSKVVSFEVDMELTGGAKVNIKVTHPDGQVIDGIMALAQAGKPNIVNGLLHGMQDDPSVAKWLEEQHIGFDTDPEWDEEWEEDENRG